MPEGDTVWNTARVLERALAGDVLTGSDFRVPQLATTDLSGWTVAESASRGKHLLLRLTSDGQARTLHSHLRMDGAWRAFAPGERWSGRPAHLIRVVLRTRRSVAVGYHLHEMALIPTADEARLLGYLGPDLLGDDWDPDEAVRRIRETPDIGIAEALLDQRNLAGVGNLYKCRDAVPARAVAVDAGPRRRGSGRHGHARAEAGRVEQGPLVADHDRITSPGRDQLRLRAPRPAVPALRDGRSGRPSRATGSRTGVRAASPSRPEPHARWLPRSWSCGCHKSDANSRKGNHNSKIAEG